MQNHLCSLRRESAGKTSRIWVGRLGNDECFKTFKVIWIYNNEHNSSDNNHINTYIWVIFRDDSTVFQVGFTWLQWMNGAWPCLRLGPPIGRTPNLAQFHRSREILAWVRDPGTTVSGFSWNMAMEVNTYENTIFLVGCTSIYLPAILMWTEGVLLVLTHCSGHKVQTKHLGGLGWLPLKRGSFGPGVRGRWWQRQQIGKAEPWSVVKNTW